MMSATTDVPNKDGENAKNGGIPEGGESVTGTLENGNESDPLELIGEQDSFELGHNDDIDNNSDVWKGSDSEDETGNVEKSEQQNDPKIVNKNTEVEQEQEVVEPEPEQDVVEPEQEQTTNGPSSSENIDETNEVSDDKGLDSSSIGENEKDGDKQVAEKGSTEESPSKAETTDRNCNDEGVIKNGEGEGEGIEKSLEKKSISDESNQKVDQEDVVLIEDQENNGKDKVVEESSEKNNPGCENDATDKNCEVQMVTDDKTKDKANADEPVTGNDLQNSTGNTREEETPMETEDADLDDCEDFDAFDPSLLCPEMSMAIDESPVVTTTENGPNGSESPLPYDEMYSSYVDEVTGAEIDIKLTQEEQDIRKRMYSGTNPVQYARIHCTACNLHLGSALETQNNRFVHPLLKVIICKKCYNFYTSGEFEKDEDGSELYCRWCGQGGQVLCCSKCEFVFCKKCIRTNCGKKKLSEIKNSDEWDCFRCNPGQIKLLKVTCAEFFDYVRRERTRASTLNDPEFMKIDYCRCCQKSTAQKRPLEEGEENKKPKAKRRKVPLDEDYDPLKHIIVEKPPQQQKLPSNASGPIRLNMIPGASRMILPKPGVATGPVRPGTIPGPARLGTIPGPIRPAPHTLPHLVINPMQPNTPKPNTMPPRYQFVPAAQRPTVQAPALVRIGAPIVRQPPPLIGPGNNRMQGLLQDRLTQGNKPPGTPMKHEWFEKTIRASARVTAHLSYTLTQLNKTQSQAGSVEELAVVHNKLQEILSSSINSLIQVRKNLRTEFINGIKTVRFPPKPIPAQPKFTSAIVTQDDDVIFVPSAPPPVIVLDPTPSTSRPTITEPRPSTSLIPISKPPPKVTTLTTTSNAPRGPYLKVKSFTQLQSVTADCIILPDDPEPPPQPEKDPLALEVDKDKTENEVTCNGSSSVSKEKEIENTQMDTRSIPVTANKNELMNEKSKYNVQGSPSAEVKRMMSVLVKVKRDDLNKLQEDFSKKCQQVV